MTMRIRNFRELRAISSFEERYDYLRLFGDVGRATFGFERYINQRFYTSAQWKQVRSAVIARDFGCDLAMDGYDIPDKIIVHHMNPMTIQDLEDGNPDILNPDYLISTSLRTHNAIHYGDRSNLIQPIVERKPGDTLLWRRIE